MKGVFRNETGYDAADCFAGGDGAPIFLAACKDGKEKTDPSIGPAVVSNDSSETLDAAKPEEGSDTATGEGGSQATQSDGQTLPASGIKATTDKAYVLQLYKDCLAIRRML